MDFTLLQSCSSVSPPLLQRIKAQSLLHHQGSNSTARSVLTVLSLLEDDCQTLSAFLPAGLFFRTGLFLPFWPDIGTLLLCLFFPSCLFPMLLLFPGFSP